MKVNLIFASVVIVSILTACNDGVRSVDATCSGLVVTTTHQYGQEQASKESRVFPFHYNRSNKLLTIGKRYFPSASVEERDGEIYGAMKTINRQMSDGTTLEINEIVRYSVKTNIVYHETAIVRSGIPENTGRFTTEIFETVCKPSK